MFGYNEVMEYFGGVFLYTELGIYYIQVMSVIVFTKDMSAACYLHICFCIRIMGVFAAHYIVDLDELV